MHSINNKINKKKVENNIKKILNKFSENDNYNSLKINMIHNLYKISKKFNLEELIEIFETKYKKILDKKIIYWSSNIINNIRFKKNIINILEKNKINIEKYNIKDEFHITLFFPEKEYF